MHVGVTLRSALDARGWTQHELALVTGIQEAAVSAIVQGSRTLRPADAILIGAALAMGEEYWAMLAMRDQLLAAHRTLTDRQLHEVIIKANALRAEKRNRLVGRRLHLVAPTVVDGEETTK